MTDNHKSHGLLIVKEDRTKIFDSEKLKQNKCNHLVKLNYAIHFELIKIFLKKYIKYMLLFCSYYRSNCSNYICNDNSELYDLIENSNLNFEDGINKYVDIKLSDDVFFTFINSILLECLPIIAYYDDITNDNIENYPINFFDDLMVITCGDLSNKLDMHNGFSSEQTKKIYEMFIKICQEIFFVPETNYYYENLILK